MPINSMEVLEAVQQLADIKGIRVTVSQSAKAACIVGGSAFVGSLLGGPVGLGLGGIIGSLLTATSTRGNYKSVVYIIQHEMTSAQRRKLANSLYNVVKDVDAADISILISILTTNDYLFQLVIKQLRRFLNGELGYTIVT